MFTSSPELGDSEGYSRVWRQTSRLTDRPNGAPRQSDRQTTAGAGDQHPARPNPPAASATASSATHLPRPELRQQERPTGLREEFRPVSSFSSRTDASARSTSVVASTPVPLSESSDFNAAWSAAPELDWTIHRPVGRYVPGAETKSLPRARVRRDPPLPPPGAITGSLPRPAPRRNPCPCCHREEPAHRPCGEVATPRYQEAAVNIHYRSPVRWEEREPLSDQELQQRQEENMRRVYQEARRRKEEKQREDIMSRRHGDNFTPSQKSPIPLDRYERLFDDVADSSAPTLTATALHEFRAQNNRSLTQWNWSLTRGDTVRIRRKIDSNWYEGQKSSRIGIFPVSYVRVHDPRERSVERWAPRPQVRARHRFSAQTHLELSLNKGDIVSVIRRVDDNWYEGRRGDAIGIFPISYVEAVGSDAPREHSVPRMKPVGAPAAHGLVKDGNALRAPGDPLKVDVQQQPVPYRVQFSYRHQNDDELDLEEGDVIHVLERCPDGWYVGTNLRTGMFGTFPGNYTAKM